MLTNLTVEMFRVWVTENYDCNICKETARKWLHKLGFKQVNHTKEVYFDGHERTDIVKYRGAFLDKLEDLDRKCIYEGHTPQLFAGEKPLIHIHHDESTFFANADQKCYWADGSTNVLKQKSLGQSIMVSDFIEEGGTDYLSNDGNEARLLLESQADGHMHTHTYAVCLDTVTYAIVVANKEIVLCISVTVLYNFIARV